MIKSRVRNSKVLLKMMNYRDQTPIFNTILNQKIPLFVAGFLFDSESIHGNLPKEILKSICTMIPVRFSFIDHFDQKGVLSWLRNIKSDLIDRENVICFNNSFQCDTLSLKTFKWSSSVAKQSVSVEILGQEMIAPLLYFYEDDEMLVIDLQRFELKVTDITISSQNLQNSDHFLSYLDVKTEFQGSNDRVVWESIPTKQSVTKDFKMVQTYELKTNNYYRFFKINDHYCKGSRKSRKSIFSGIEMYGYI